MMARNWLFGSFFLGGFECSTHLTFDGHRMDLAAVTRHVAQAWEDYLLCRAAGIRAVREAARWPLIDCKGALDLGEVRRLARLGREAGLTLIWDLMHYGYPDDLDPFTRELEFRERFTAYARAVAAVVREETLGATYFTPINEISYCAWAAGDVGYMAPFGRGRGGEYKRILVRAAIAATDEVWEIDPEANIVNADPLIRVHPPENRPDLQPQADHFNEHIVNEAFDLLAGRLEPELGGSRAYLGMVGLNYYSCNQWTIATPEQPQRFLGLDEPKWVPLHKLLAAVAERYGGPLVIAETGALGDDRPGWLAYLAREARRALERGVDLQGICLYPIITSPDWEDPTAFFEGGLFDVVPEPDGSLRRILVEPVAAALRDGQARLDPGNLPTAPLTAEPSLSLEAHVEVIRPFERARFKPDNFSYQTLLAGESLLVELYGVGPGASIPQHRHEATEHVLTVVSGEAHVWVDGRPVLLRQGETLLVPAGLLHGIANPSIDRLVVQQVSGPKPWDARFGGPHPTSWGDSPRLRCSPRSAGRVRAGSDAAPGMGRFLGCLPEPARER
jgi:quercetin dioxygenase-like cupin family protein